MTLSTYLNQKRIFFEEIGSFKIFSLKLIINNSAKSEFKGEPIVKLVFYLYTLLLKMKKKIKTKKIKSVACKGGSELKKILRLERTPFVIQKRFV